MVSNLESQNFRSPETHLQAISFPLLVFSQFLGCIVLRAWPVISPPHPCGRTERAPYSLKPIQFFCYNEIIVFLNSEKRIVIKYLKNGQRNN